MFDFLLSETNKAVRDRAREFVKSVPAQLIRDMDADKVQFPTEFLKSAAAHKLLGLRFEPLYGGGGYDWKSEAAAIEEIGTLGAPLACLYSLVSIVGEALHVFGTPAQKARYLAPVLKGEKFCAEGLTEPRGGSDFFGATSNAVDKGDYFELNGQKRFIVGGEGADFFLIYARTNFEPNVPPHKQISALLVDRDDTVRVEHRYGLMGSRGGGTARIVFTNTRVPKENAILGVNRGTDVFNRMMVPERMTTACGAVGAARAALEVATRYTTRRKAFGKPIQKFQAVSFHIAEAVAKLDSARALVWATANKIDSGEDARRMVSESKKIATEHAWDVVNRSMQVMGGIGYTDIFPIERLLRDLRLMMIWTGTNEIMNLLIQHEWYAERAANPTAGRDVEVDAVGFENEEEKHYG
jgi:alkylation response protein AidB-like acyl-CoA dehydrogenase